MLWVLCCAVRSLSANGFDTAGLTPAAPSYRTCSVSEETWRWYKFSYCIYNLTAAVDRTGEVFFQHRVSRLVGWCGNIIGTQWYNVSASWLGRDETTVQIAQSIACADTSRPRCLSVTSLWSTGSGAGQGWTEAVQYLMRRKQNAM